MAYTEHYYSSHDGLNLYYRSYGAGEKVLVCLPGLTRNSKDFNELAEHFGAHWRVITPDLRGRGQSDWDSKSAHYNLGMYTRDIWSLVDGLGIEKFVIIGTSLGGLIAMTMVDQQARLGVYRLNAIVLNDIGPEVAPAGLARIMQYVGRAPAVTDWQAAAVQAQQLYELAIPGMPEDFWLKFVRQSYREDESGKPIPDMDPAIGLAAAKAQKFISLLTRLCRLGLIRRVGGVNIDPWDSFRAISMPCLLVHGALSDILTFDIVDKMKKVKPDLAVVSVTDRGHAPLLDEEDVLPAIENFLSEL